MYRFSLLAQSTEILVFIPRPLAHHALRTGSYRPGLEQPLLELVESGVRNQLTDALRPVSEDLTIKSLLIILLNLRGGTAGVELNGSQRDPLPPLSLPTSNFQHLQQSIVHLIRLPNAYSHCSEEELWLLHFSRPHQHTGWGGGAMAEPTI